MRRNAWRSPAHMPKTFTLIISFTTETLDLVRRKVGAEHLMLGTDFPYVLGDWMCVDKIEALPCPETEKNLILEGNARKLLKISVS